MEVNSQSLIIETPVKDKNPAEASLALADDHSHRGRSKRLPVSVSVHLESGILSIERMHRFFHTNQLTKMEDMKLKLTLRNRIRDLFSGFDQDFSDCLKQMEKNAIETKLYSNFIRDYIREGMKINVR